MFTKRFPLLLSCCTLLACQRPESLGPGVSQHELAAETAIQRQAAEEARASGGKPQAWKRKPGERQQFERVAARIETASAALCRDMGLPARGRSCYYHMQLSSSPQINAEADGSKVVIHSGMMSFIDNDDELAAVIGHELSHNLMDHIGSKQTNALLGMVAGALIEGVAASQGISTNGQLTQSATDIGTIVYSTEFEREADYIGLYIAARAGYDPHKAIHYWRRLSVHEPSSINGGLTHPSNPSRFVAMQKTIAEIEAKQRSRLLLLPEVTRKN